MLGCENCVRFYGPRLDAFSPATFFNLARLMYPWSAWGVSSQLDVP